MSDNLYARLERWDDFPPALRLTARCPFRMTMMSRCDGRVDAVKQTGEA
jgi:hypothetical protein